MPIRRKVSWIFVLILLVACPASTGLAVYLLYRTAIAEEQARLIELAQSQARLIEAIHRTTPAGDDHSAIMNIIQDTHTRYRGYSEASELSLGLRKGDQMVFLLRHRGDRLIQPEPLSMDSSLGEPMRRALAGESGVLIGPDYRGVRVLAAFEAVPEMNLGVVAKIDLDAVQGPFIRAGFWVTGATLALTGMGMVLFFGLVSPLVRRLETSEDRLRGIFDAADDVILLMDRDLRHIMKNAAYFTSLGYEKDDPGMPDIWARLHPDDVPTIKAHMEEALARGRSTAEYRVRHRDESWRHRISKALVIPGPGGGPGSILAIIRDITARHNREQALRESEQTLRALFDAIPESVFLMDPEGNYLLANEVTARRLGVTVEELIGRSIFDLFEPELAATRWEWIREVCRTGRPVHFEDVRDNRSLDSHLYPIIDNRGLVTRVAVLAIDQTKRRQMEEDLRARESQLQVTLAEKDTLLREVHHRVKNNLQIVTSLLNMQARAVDNPRVREVLADSRDRIKAMALVHETLYRTTVGPGIDLREYISQLTVGLEQTWRTQGGSVRFSLAIDPVTIPLDQTVPCGLVLNELATNSLKYATSPASGGEIRIGATLTGDGELELTFQDDGAGLPEHLMSGPRSSMGLSLVTMLVEGQLNGRLMIENAPGARFVIHWPVTEEAKRQSMGDHGRAI